MRQKFRCLIRGSGVATLVVVTACGGRETVASKSARAFRDAQAKGQPIGGSHGGHDQSTSATTAPAIDHSTMAGMDHSKMNMPGGATGMAGMDHSKMPGMQHGNASPRQHSMAGTDHADMPRMQHGNTSQRQHSMAGMDHANIAGMQHGGTGALSAVAVSPAATNTDTARVRSASTLAPDALDMPASIAVSEANKSAQNVPDGDIRRIVPGQDQETPPTPQSAIWGSPLQPTAPGTSQPAMNHSEHGATSPTPAPRPRSVAKPRVAPPAAAIIYTCPMHPEITSTKPGTCPKCGMALVKKN